MNLIPENNEIDYLSIIDFNQVKDILRELFELNPHLQSQFNQLAKHRVEIEDYGDIAEDLFSELEYIDIETVWREAGTQPDGEYMDTYDIIYEKIEEILEPYLDKFNLLIGQELFIEANIICKGLLKGLYDFENNKNLKIADWLQDSPLNIAENEILDIWNKVREIEDPEIQTEFLQKDLKKWNFS